MYIKKILSPGARTNVGTKATCIRIKPDVSHRSNEFFHNISTRSSPRSRVGHIGLQQRTVQILRGEYNFVARKRPDVAIISCHYCRHVCVCVFPVEWSACSCTKVGIFSVFLFNMFFLVCVCAAVVAVLHT